MQKLQLVKNELIRFGLSENQATIYLFLVQCGEQRIQEISKLVKMPRSSVYECLRGLSELGLVEEIIDDNFKRIKSYPVSLLKHYLEDKRQEIEKLSADLDSLEQTITSLPNHASGQTGTLRSYKGVSGARQLLWNTLKAKDTIYVYSAWGRGRAVGMKFYEKFVTESRLRGIKEKVLINPNVRTIDSLKRYHGSPTARTNIGDIRSLDEKTILLRGETFIYDTTYAQIYLKEGPITGFEISNSSYIKTQRSVFETFWGMATPVETLV